MDHDRTPGVGTARRRRASLVGAAIALLLVVGGAVTISQRIHPPAEPAAGRSGTPRSPGPPAAPAGMRWVGVGRTVVAVPERWPVVPGVYCQGPPHPFVTLTQWHVAVGCVPTPDRHRGSPRDQPAVRVSGDATGRFTARLAGPDGSGGVTRHSLRASRATLPRGWLTVPSGEPYGGAGPPTVTSELAALAAAGFRAVLRPAAPDRDGRAVTTDPETGTPARRGSTVVVHDHGAPASSARLVGRLRWIGGPAPGRTVSHPGTVHVVNADDSVDQTAEAGADGRWEVRLPPGTYRVLATSPGYGSPAGRFDACSAGRTVVVGAGGSLAVDVWCQLA